MLAVTSFSEEGYERYGRRFLETYVKHWPCNLFCYYEVMPDFRHPKITYKNLFSIKPLVGFLEAIADQPAAHGMLNGKYTYMLDANKFCRKSFAQLDTDDETVFWLDADIVTFKDVGENFLRSLFGGRSYCYLGRDTYSECGFIGFDQKHRDYKRLAKKYLDVYMSGDIFKLPGWHDCYAFDAARQGIKGNNLSPDGKGVDHVFVKSVLGEYMDHVKGPNRKSIGHSPEHPKQWW